MTRSARAPDSFRPTSGPRLLDVRRLWAEPDALASPRGRQVRARFPDAEVITVASHWKIDELHGNAGNIDRWIRVKTEDLVLGVKKSLTARENGRSADWIAPSTSNGCAMACAYCYVPRRKGYANPITVFTNIDKIIGYLGGHVRRQGPKTVPNQCDPHAWVYDLGENSDCSVDALVSDNVADLITAFGAWPTAKASFATKYVNRDLLDLDPRGRTRIRFSLMPEADSQLLDLRTTPIRQRIAAIDDFVAAGYEVHVNFSPVVVRPGLGGGLGGAAGATLGRHGLRVQGPGRCGDHHAHAQRAIARNQPGLAPEVRGPVVAPGDPAGQALPVGHVERALPQ
ncbi:spore photoproduct lyase family protein [Nocardia gipuzkoensis]|uniref:spore photoproduct lyase family protein n=1 Tax=Nocardia abscessus TaxID=120957 RepID=UPI001E436F71|nr:hypothetical protein [Nocardia abscessus]